MQKVGAFFRHSKESEPAITGRMQEIAQALPGAELAGLEARRKGRESLCRKVASEVMQETPLDTAVAKINDSVRYTFLFSPEGYSEQTRSARRLLEASGYELHVFKNTWDGLDYRGINSTWRDPRSGTYFEVQFHTPESYAAKTESHPFYEVTRLPAQSPETRAAARAAGRAITDKVKPPPGANDLR
jgi:hypothetical protein